uniref:Uncharacterized protein n=1 Tax=Octopus bimaculoides TaxID=37653 RepID=A0A0L8G6I5_OCTBM
MNKGIIYSQSPEFVPRVGPKIQIYQFQTNTRIKKKKRKIVSRQTANMFARIMCCGVISLKEGIKELEMVSSTILRS